MATSRVVPEQIGRIPSLTDQIHGYPGTTWYRGVIALSAIVVASLLAGCGAPPPSIPPGSTSAEVSAAVSSPSDGVSPSRSIASTPEPEATPWPEYTLAPAADDVLELAGRSGVPGMLYCHKMPFTFDALDGPVGAEVRVGPEYDALRSYSVGAPTVTAASVSATERSPATRSTSSSCTSSMFLPREVRTSAPRSSSMAHRGGTPVAATVVPEPWLPQGTARATWTLDPEFPAPNADTRTLHIRVTELACASGRSASGRISPAFVTWSADEMVVEVFVQPLPGGGDCQSNPPTPATLRLPVPLGDRTLFHGGSKGLGGAGG